MAMKTKGVERLNNILLFIFFLSIWWDEGREREREEGKRE